MTVKVVTDSTADLPPEVARALDISVVPVYVTMRGKSYRDGVDIDLDRIYGEMLEHGTPITTSQPAPGDFAEVYRHLLKEADDIVSIHLTGRLSGVYQSAQQGREAMGGAGTKGRIEVVDSTTLSLGLGLVAIAAARLAKSGASISRVLEETGQAITGSHAWGMLDTLKYVLRSGRLGKAGVLLGNVLAVKPMLTMREGELHPSGFVRTRQKGIEKLIDNIARLTNVEEIGITQSTTPDEARSLKLKLSAIVDASRIHVSRLGPALGVHGGPGTLILAARTRATSLSPETERARRLINMPSIHIPRLNITPA
jgi:DegV family protein with EDD domain